MPKRHSRRINRAIGKNPTLGGIPLSLVFPAFIALGIAAVLRLVLALSWPVMLLIACWLTASWLIATGGNSFKFFSKFRIPPIWIRGAVNSQSLLKRNAQAASSNKTKNNKTPKNRRSL